MIRALLALLLIAGPAQAIIRITDGACAPSNGGLGCGNGTTLTCGGTNAPFCTIMDGIANVQPGDILEVRGPHDAFNGIYFESLEIAPPRSGVTLPNHFLNCTLSQPCFITGCRASDTGGVCQDEVPIIRGMELQNDWTPLTGDVWTRLMEVTPDPNPVIGTGGTRVLAGSTGCPTEGGCCPSSNNLCGNFDPYTIYEDDGSGLANSALQYAGDGLTTTVPAGRWSFDVNTNRITVHMRVPGANPATRIYVPHFSYNVWLKPPTSFLTLQYMTFEGFRFISNDYGQAGQDTPGIATHHITVRYGKDMGFHYHQMPGILFDNDLVEWGGRFSSFNLTSSDTFFGYRGFHSPGGHITGSTCQHLGYTGNCRWSGGQAWPCSNCTPPGNDPTNYCSMTSVCFQIKQTDGYTMDNSRCTDAQGTCFSNDVSRNTNYINNSASQVGGCFGMFDFTPDPASGCDVTNPADFCNAANVSVDRLTCIDAGKNDAQHCSVFATGQDNTHRPPGTSFLFHLTNSQIIRCGYGCVCIGGMATSNPGDFTIAQNSMSGHNATADASPARGIIITQLSTNGNDGIINNVIDNMLGPPVVLASAVTPLLSNGVVTLAGQLYGTHNGAADVCWNATVPFQNGQPSCGNTGTVTAFQNAFTGQEVLGSEGDPGYVDPNANLDLLNSSVARDSGVDAALIPISNEPHDFHNNVRPQGSATDKGMDEFFLGTTSTSAPTTTTTSSTTTSSTTVTTTTHIGQTTTSTTTVTTTTGTTTPPTTLPPGNFIILRGNWTGLIGRQH